MKVRGRESADYLDQFEHWLWQITRFYLPPYAQFEEGQNAFVLNRNPFPSEPIHLGPYRSGRNVDDANVYRIGHPLAQRLIGFCQNIELPERELTFHYSTAGRNVAALAPTVGKSGWMLLARVTVSAFEIEDHLVFSAVTDGGDELDATQCQRLFSLNADEGGAVTPDGQSPAFFRLTEAFQRQRTVILARITERNRLYFEQQLDKLDRWGEDQRNSLKLGLKEIEERIREVRREGRLASNLPDKIKLERHRRELESQRDEAWKRYEAGAREIEKDKDLLMDEVEKRLNQQVTDKTVFRIRWSVK